MLKMGNYSICLIYLFIAFAHCLYEDQIGKFDWTQKFIGKAKLMTFDLSSQMSRRIVVATEQNVLASLNARDGKIGWRAVFENDDRGRIDDIFITKNYIVTVHGGGEYVRCFKSITGSLQWEHPASVDLTDERARFIAMSNKNSVAVLTRRHVILYKLDSGEVIYKKSLPDSVDVVYSLGAVVSGDLVIVGVKARSHVALLTYADDGALKTDVSVPAPWLSERAKCDVIGSHSLVCLDGQLVQVVSLLEPLVFTPSTALQDLGVSGEQLTIERLHGSDEPRSEFVVRAAATHVIVLGLTANATVALIRNMEGVALVQAGQVGGQSGGQDGDAQHFLLSIQRATQNQGIEVTGYSLPSGRPESQLSYSFHSKQLTSLPQLLSTALFNKKDGSVGFRLLVASQDDSLSLLSAVSAGRVLWTREEALARIVSVDMLDLPLSELQAEMEDEFGARGDNMFALFIRRISTQFTQLKTFIGQLRHKLLTPRHTTHSAAAGSDGDDDGDVTDGDTEDDDDALTRDEFNLHKVIVTVTASGKILGLDSRSGRTLWHHFLADIAPLNVHEAMPLFVQRTTSHFPHPPQCSVLGRHRASGQGLIYSFNPITGERVKGMPPSGQVLNLQLKQATMMSQMDVRFLHPLVILTADNKYIVYPPSAREMVQSLAAGLYMFTTDVSVGELTGFSMVPRGEELLARPLWTVNLDKESQVITHVKVKRAIERVHSQGIVLADRSVLYKYLNPNLIAVVTEDQSEKGLMSIHLVDAVTGNLVFHCSHRRARGPVHIVHSENWVTYSYWNTRHRRTEVAVLELYEGKKQSNATSFSSLDPPPPPLVMRQAYVFSAHVTTMAATVTERGLTNKHLLIGLTSGAVLELPKSLLDPRRPIVPTADHKEEGIMPYMPELPLPYEAIINYNQTIFKTHGIHTSPSGLESTCLVLCYGLDLFYTQVTPSKMFDVLKEDFDYLFISAVLVAMIVISIVSQKLATRKALKRAWK